WRIVGAGAATPATSGSRAATRPGYLVINPLGVPRRVPVLLPDAALDLRPEGPLRCAQFTDAGVEAVVELPAIGFAWVPREADLGRPPASLGAMSTRGRQLQNESIAVDIDPATGGIRGLSAPRESQARLGQQLVMTGLGETGGKPVVSQMRSERF